MSVRIAPSILAADFSRLADEVTRVAIAGADLIHVDVMDGHFVPSITFGPLVVAALKRATRVPLDVHMMVADPERHLAAIVDAGADMVTIHVEATSHLHRVIAHAKELGARAGAAINPATPVAVLTDIAADLDHILVMSVNPGLTGQKFIPHSYGKVTEAAALVAARGGRAEIEVDGGVDAGNAASLVAAGATILVAGAAVFHTADAASAVAALRRAAGGR
jgi:ribulose-phosphate 3-epimerase